MLWKTILVIFMILWTIQSCTEAECESMDGYIDARSSVCREEGTLKVICNISAR